MLSYFLLALSIGLELFATTMLKASDGFTRPLQTVACVLGYVGSFYTLTHVLKYIPLSVTYATWSGVGLVVTALISVFIFSEGYNIYTYFGDRSYCSWRSNPKPVGKCRKLKLFVISLSQIRIL